MTIRRRETEWFESIVGFTSRGTNTQFAVDLYSAAFLGAHGIKGSTITRTVVKLALLPEVQTTIVELHWGIVIVNADAVAAGVLPDANDVADRADWLIRGWLFAKSGNISDGSQTDRVIVDLRSQRIIRAEEDQLTLVVNMSNPWT